MIKVLSSWVKRSAKFEVDGIDLSWHLFLGKLHKSSTSKPVNWMYLAQCNEAVDVFMVVGKRSLARTILRIFRLSN